MGGWEASIARIQVVEKLLGQDLTTLQLPKNTLAMSAAAAKQHRPWAACHQRKWTGLNRDRKCSPLTLLFFQLPYEYIHIISLWGGCESYSPSDGSDLHKSLDVMELRVASNPTSLSPYKQRHALALHPSSLNWLDSKWQRWWFPWRGYERKRASESMPSACLMMCLCVSVSLKSKRRTAGELK